MSIRLLHPARINFNAGDVVEASPAQSSFLISVGCAVPVEDNRGAKETPEDLPKVETPEKKTRKTGKK